ncbi:peptidyl-prolyl cis-trans isomerase D [Candidatus Xenohaliotis californiensis]|uniref:Parvulin-like PPIase n=1 Tax=Candidatus Xenohaliotis californiensis TaxID=84677 RepID=A0ABM9N6Z9_9RICK|nr:peptidyl-prolyl cis-trans isomerase D [Candidatus Xenohaliotis californiensis]
MKKWVKIVAIASSVAFLSSIASSSLLNFTQNKNDTVAKIGSSKITSKEYNGMYQRELARIQQAIGQNLTEEQIQMLKIKQNIMNQLIWHKMLGEFINKEKLKVDKQILFEQIAKIPYFLDKDGKFNQQNFHDILHANGMSEDEYLKMLSEDVISNIIIESLMRYKPKENYVLNQLFQHKHESRIADIITIQSIKPDEKYQSNEKEILEFFNNNKEKMQSPEYRKIEYVVVDASNYPSDKIKISDDEVEKEFQLNIDSYTSNPKKNIISIVFNTQDDADKFLQEVKSNNFNSALAKLDDNNAVEITKLNDVTTNELPSPVGEVVNSLNEGEISAVTKSALGWHVIKVEKSKNLNEETSAQIKQDIKKYLIDKHKIDRMLNIVETIENNINAGDDMATIAKDHNLTLSNTTLFTIQNAAMHPGIKDLIADEPSIIAKIFSLKINEYAVINIGDDDKYLIFKISEIMPSKQKSLEEARDDIVNSLRIDHAHHATLKIASNVVEEIKNGQKNIDIKNVSIKEMVQIYRADVAKSINPTQQYSTAFVKEIFATNINHITKPYEHENTMVLAHVKKIKPVGKDLTIEESDILNKFQYTISNLAQEDMYKNMRDNLKVVMHKLPSTILDK